MIVLVRLAMPIRVFSIHPDAKVDYGQGNIVAVLDMLAEDVDWQTPATRPEPVEISWARPRRGREQVVKFFQDFAEKVNPEPLRVSLPRSWELGTISWSCASFSIVE